MNKILIILFVLFIMPSNAISAIIKANVEVKDSLHGKTICVLNKEAFVRESSKIDDGYNIEIDLYAAADDFKELPLSDVALRDMDNNIVGYTRSYKPEEWDYIDNKTKKGKLFIEGYIHKKYIVDESLVANKIINIVNSNNPPNYYDLKNILSDWLRSGAYDIYEGKKDNIPPNLKVLILFNTNAVQYIPKAIFGFINDKLFIIGVNENYCKYVNTIKRDNKYYYIIKKDINENIDNYIRSVYDKFEYVQ